MMRRRHLWAVRRRRVDLARLVRRAEAEYAIEHCGALLSEWTW